MALNSSTSSIKGTLGSVIIIVFLNNLVFLDIIRYFNQPIIKSFTKMNAIKKLSGKDLSKLIDEAAKELSQRKRMEVLSKDIQRVIAKHKVSKTELASLIEMIRSETKVSKKTKTRAASKVPAKFKNPNGQETWTGRGRAPNWVSGICETTGLTVPEFKASPAYLISE